jgi:hypothetical protein
VRLQRHEVARYLRAVGEPEPGSPLASSWGFSVRRPVGQEFSVRATITITYQCDARDRLPDEVDLSGQSGRASLLRALVEAHLEADELPREPIDLEEYRERRDLERSLRF